MRIPRPPKTRFVRSLFISDLHLGFRHSRATELLDFLMNHEPEYLYLVGDFIDGWSLQKGGHWQPECNLIVARLMDLARHGTQIRLAIGNHDNFLRDPVMQWFIGESGMVEVAEEYHHQMADGRRFLVLHGDQFDDYEKSSILTVGLLSLSYDVMLRANAIWSRCTSAAMHGRFSLVARAKDRLSFVRRHVSRFRNHIVQHARLRGCHGVICGHIHAPQQLNVDGLMYCNTGDWVENCTALIEDHAGRLQLMWLGDDAAEPVDEAASPAVASSCLARESVSIPA